MTVATDADGLLLSQGGSEDVTPMSGRARALVAFGRPGGRIATPACRSCQRIVSAVTPSSAPIWRRVRSWAYKSAARLTSTAPR